MRLESARRVTVRGFESHTLRHQVLTVDLRSRCARPRRPREAVPAGPRACAADAAGPCAWAALRGQLHAGDTVVVLGDDVAPARARVLVVDDPEVELKLIDEPGPGPG